MKIVNPSAEFYSEVDGNKILKNIEKIGRVCYKSEGNITEGSAISFVKNLIRRKHFAMLEHESISVKVVCDRGISHEIVRHRIASYCVTGDTIIPSYSSRKRSTGKKRTIEDIYNWSQDSRCQAAFKHLIIRSVDENSLTIIPNKIEKVFYNGEKPVYKIVTESGRNIKCTAQHSFLTPIGWRQLNELSVGSIIYVNGLELLNNEEWLRHNYLILNKTRKQVAEEIGCSESTLFKAFKRFNIVKSWSDRPNRKPGRGKKGALTPEGRRRLIESKVGINNPKYIKDREQLKISGGYAEAHRKFEGEKIECEFCGSTKNLEIHHCDKNPRNNNEDNIKILCPSCHRLWHYPNAIGVFSEKIVCIEYIGFQKVYDLQMTAPYNNYVANGIIVHNSQESSRYCNYASDKFGNEISVICPFIPIPDYAPFIAWKSAVKKAEEVYIDLVDSGISPEIARSVLPTCLATELVITMNLREWRHFFSLRLSPKAHPQMVEIATMILHMFKKEIPVIFDDIEVQLT